MLDLTDERVGLRSRLRRGFARVPALPGNTTSMTGSPHDRVHRPNATRWAVALAMVIVAGIGMIAADGGAIVTALSALVLLGAGVLLGLTADVARRSELERQIETRSSELGEVLTELEVAQAETVHRLSMAVEFRDEDTGAHIERIGRFSTMLAELIGMEQDYCRRLSHAAPLHDVGKVAIPDAILLKPGPLTPDERAIVETHAEEGHRLLRGSSSSILHLAATIALSHHEKWDGTGYPRGVAGEAIPIEGRIVAIADVFDALTSDRVYRKAFSLDQAVEMMMQQRGRHFDPVLLDAFMEVLDNTGPDARAKTSGDPTDIVENALDTYAKAIEGGDAEMAEGAIMQAIEDGVDPVTLHSEVFAPALIRIESLARGGQIDAHTERLAIGITRRILATLYRYMLGGTEHNRERIMLVGLEADGHMLELQMVHDQLAAVGYQTTIDTSFSVERLRELRESQPPNLLVVGITTASDAEAAGSVVKDLLESHPDVPVVAWAATGAASSRLQDLYGTTLLERIEQSVPVVEELLAHAHAVS
jgi:HD-GYP domain-containing protein (c-di-GMP phosphodiesterase class II)